MTAQIRVTSRSPEDTARIAGALGRLLEPPCLILLKGGMGSGKTAFSKAFAAGAGSHDDTGSPTFTIVNTYESPKGPIHHFDLYRLADEDELYAMGFDDYFAEDALVLVEWPDIAALDSQAGLIIELNQTDTPDQRCFTFTGDETRIARIREALYER